MNLSKHLSTWLRTISVCTYLAGSLLLRGRSRVALHHLLRGGVSENNQQCKQRFAQTGREQHDEVFVDVQLTVRLHREDRMMGKWDSC